MGKIETTIIISNYNYDKYVKDALQSCVLQSVPCQIIIVDDASTDQSWPVIQKFVKKHAGNKLKPICAVRLLENSNGNARGKNIGITLTRSKYITCFDSDDFLLSNGVKCRLKSIKKAKADWSHAVLMWIQSKASYQKILSDRSLSTYSKKKNPSKHTMIYHKFRLARNDKYRRNKLYIEGTTLFYKRKLHDIVGLYDEELRWRIDKEMYARFLNYNFKRIFVDNFVGIYRKHPQQASCNPKRKNMDKVEQVYKKAIEERKHITEENTLMPQNYDAYKYIDQICGDKEICV